jgi:hypothetical protein
VGTEATSPPYPIEFSREGSGGFDAYLDDLRGGSGPLGATGCRTYLDGEEINFFEYSPENPPRWSDTVLRDPETFRIWADFTRHERAFSRPAEELWAGLRRPEFS